MREAPESAEAKLAPPVVAGVRPWLPWPLSRWRWWNDPVPAERLAILRIGLAFFLLLDIALTYLPHAATFFGRDSLGTPAVFDFLYKPEWSWDAVKEDAENLRADTSENNPFHRTLERRWRWSLLYHVVDPRVIRGAMLVWLAATFLLLLGFATRPAAVAVWLLSTSVANINSYIDNGGDQIRYIITLYLMLTPCGAAWSVDAWLRRRRGKLHGRVLVYPWALRLLFVQMVLVYFCNGVYKWSGSDWPHGDSLYYVLGDLTLTRWSYAQFPTPYWLTMLLSWTVMIWEVSFPLWVCMPWRWTAGYVPALALAFGVAFHLGIFVSMELGFFVPYMLCLYLPLLPAERLAMRRSQVMDAKLGASTRTKSA